MMMTNTQDSQNTTYYGFQVYVWAKSQSPITGQFVDPCLWLTDTLPLFSAPTTDKLKIWRRQILSRVYEEPNKLPSRPGLHTPFRTYRERINARNSHDQENFKT